MNENQISHIDDSEYSPSRKHKEVLDYIKLRGMVIQPDVRDHFAPLFKFKNKESARQGIHQIICNLERKDLITCQKVRHVNHIVPVKLLRAVVLKK